MVQRIEIHPHEIKYWFIMHSPFQCCWYLDYLRIQAMRSYDIGLVLHEYSYLSNRGVNFQYNCVPLQHMTKYCALLCNDCSNIYDFCNDPLIVDSSFHKWIPLTISICHWLCQSGKNLPIIWNGKRVTLPMVSVWIPSLFSPPLTFSCLSLLKQRTYDEELQLQGKWNRTHDRRHVGIFWS